MGTWNMVIENRKARYDYFIEETLECGIVLSGNEVKSLRLGQASIKESWVAIENGELVIKKMHINGWDTSNKFDIDEDRERKLLAHKSEIKDIDRKIQLNGYTIIPLKVCFKDGKAKVLIGVCKGKHNYDKRETERKRQIQLDINRELKN